MIPSLPEAISATHVEYLPLSPAYSKPILDVYSSRSRNPSFEENNARSVDSEQYDQREVTREDLAKIQTLRVIQQFVPLNISTVPRNFNLSYFRGSDLHYSPNVKVPAAESVRNL